MKYFDAHCHIQLSEYDEDRFQVLKRMQDAGVGGLVVGVDFKSSENAVELVRAYGATDSNIQMYTAVGLHPNDTDEPYNAEGFEELARQPEVVAIGECGLDYYRTDVSAHPDAKALQKDIFEQQIELAVKYDKPLMIHSRPSKGGSLLTDLSNSSMAAGWSSASTTMETKEKTATRGSEGGRRGSRFSVTTAVTIVRADQSLIR